MGKAGCPSGIRTTGGFDLARNAAPAPLSLLLKYSGRLRSAQNARQKRGRGGEEKRETPGVGGCAKTGICQIPSTPESVPVAQATDLRGPIMRPILVVLLRLSLISCVQARLAAYLSRCRGYILEVLETTRQESRGLRKAEHLGGKQTKSGYVASCCKI